MNYNEKIIAIIISVMIIVIGTFVFAENSNTVNVPDASYNQNLKPGMQTAEYNGETKISEEKAIEAAKAMFPGLSEKPILSVKKCAFTFGGYTLFSEDSLNANLELKERGYLDNTPVYIVEFGDILAYRVGGGPELKDEERYATAHRQQFVVVDAYSGYALLSYS